MNDHIIAALLIVLIFSNTRYAGTLGNLFDNWMRAILHRIKRLL